ncbi:hypothetical protein MRB53_000952 [Persea americana]|uniref:Uncharacterized protein n=1 Tax=Persea americana TaxID=3435 RepID=A0ACC2MQH1_PERAE|nr:hypothetical protein MRB53_000952 [Persea americana]
MGTSPFEVVYGKNPHGPLDLAPLPITHHFSGDDVDQAKYIQKLHEQVRARIIKQNEKYRNNANKHRKPVAFKDGDLVWIHLQKERFPPRRYDELKPQADGPFKVLQRIGENAYKIELLGDYSVSATFNVADISPYYDEENDLDLRASLPQPGENDTGVSQVPKLKNQSKKNAKTLQI